MAPRRKRSSDWQTRNRRAQALGYRNYYDYRTHHYGRVKASEPAARGEALARLRGHRSQADLLRTVGPGDIVSVYGHSERDDLGQYYWVELMVLNAAGEEHTFRLTGSQLTAKNLTKLIDELEDKDVVLSPSPSLDIRRLAQDVEETEKDAKAA